MSSRRIPLIVAIFLCWTTVAAVAVHAAPREPEAVEDPGEASGREEERARPIEARPADRLRQTGSKWALFASGGIAQVINKSADVDVATAGVRWSHLWSMKGDGSFRGHPAFAVELLPLMTFFQEPRAVGAGFNLVYEHHFAAPGSVVPVWRFGAGALFTNEVVPPGETDHNFTLLTGLGLEFPVGRSVGLSLEYRLHHVSNAGTGVRNPGINAHTLVVAIVFP